MLAGAPWQPDRAVVRCCAGVCVCVCELDYENSISVTLISGCLQDVTADISGFEQEDGCFCVRLSVSRAQRCLIHSSDRSVASTISPDTHSIKAPF